MALASSRTDPVSEIHRCGTGRFGASISTAAVLSGTRIGSTSSPHRSRPTSSTSSVPTVSCTRCASTNEKARRPNPMTIAVRTSA